MSETDAIKKVAFTVTGISQECLPKSQVAQILSSDVSIVKSPFKVNGKNSYYKKATLLWREIRAEIVKTLGATAVRSRSIGARDYIIGDGIGAVAVLAAAMRYCRILKESKSSFLTRDESLSEEDEESTEDVAIQETETLAIAKVVLCNPIANIKLHLRPFFFLASLLCMACRMNPLFMGWILFIPVFRTKGVSPERVPFGMLETIWSAHVEFEKLKLIVEAREAKLPFELELHIDKKFDFCNTEKIIAWVEKIGGKSVVLIPRRRQIPVKKLVLLSALLTWVIVNLSWLTAKLTLFAGKVISLGFWLIWLIRFLSRSLFGWLKKMIWR